MRWTVSALGIGLLSVFVASAGAMADDAVQREVAITAFRQGAALARQGRDGRPEFAKAAQAFAAMEPADVHATALFQNLGNAAFLADDLPSALWAFRSGLAYDPQHRRLREHLAYARAQVQYPMARGRPEPDSWPAWLPRLHGPSWLAVGATCSALGWVALFAWWVKRRAWLAAAAGALFAFAVTAGYGWHILFELQRRDHHFPPLVIKDDHVALRTGNGASYPRHAELPMLRTGIEARILRERGDWLQIQFGSGEIGWIPAASALVINVGMVTYISHQ